MSDSPLRARLTALIGIITAAGAASCTGGARLPSRASVVPTPLSWEDTAIADQPICIGSTVRSAGSIGDALFYRKELMPDGRLAVGYYVFYSEERPWGNNWMTWTLLPALALDMFYTRGMFIAPGVQRVMYGKGDVEGFRVVYDVAPDGSIAPGEAFADDGYHRPSRLGREELFSIDPERITVYTDSWSHHLGARGAKASDMASVRCYQKGSILPLPDAVAREFRLDRRALPAAVGLAAQEAPGAPSSSGRAVARRVDEAVDATN